MNLSERKLAAKKFMETWKGRGYEKGESQTFWLTLLRDVLGVENPENIVSFESQVKLSSTSFIDAYISTTKVLIEQKSIDKDLRAPIRQSDGTLLTPFGQAKRYASELPLSMHPRYVVTCNFKSFLVYDMENPQAEPEEVLLENLDREFSRLNFLVDGAAGPFQKELEVSIRAGEHVGEIYDALLPEFGSSPTAEDLHSLNVLCVRLVFCLYAEDAGIFEKEQFYLYLKSFRPENMRMALKDLFLTLDTPEPLRDKFLEPKLKNFPYVNGSLFRMRAEESIPPITEEIAAVLLNRASLNFDWSEISPTIFGAVFESTLNPETRRSGGMHYTSIENIHKVIDPLFLDSFREELEKIKKISGAKKRGAELLNFQRKLGSLKFLDPACGSGNFLTETYLSLRALENEALSLRLHGEAVLDVYGDSIFVHIGQFYGIEINDFAVTVAKTALWIAESQMMEKTSEILQRNLEFLPLKTNANIVEGNALRMDWGVGNREEGTGSREEKFASGFDYIMGNPPFVGARLMNAEQKKDILSVFGNVKNAGNLDYVSCWYKKTADLLKGTSTKAALVSTNSITQGEQPAILWKSLMQEGIEIDFAYRTFRWDSESAQKAHVHCVIVGFGMGKDSLAMTDANPPKFIFTESGEKIPVKNINAYLVDAPNVFIESRKKPLCDVPEIGIGNKPIDGGNYLFTEEEMRTFIKKEPRSEKYFRKWLGSDEFINGYFRYCLWLGDADPQELVKMPLVMERVKTVRNFRLASKSAPTQKLAETPTRFHVENMPAGNYILIPRVSSERRFYIPIGFVEKGILCSDSVHVLDCSKLDFDPIYAFGVLTSSVHMAWTRAVCGRLKSDYRYSKDIVYNNFPWPDLVISDQGLGTREQGLGIKGGEVYDNEFQRADCLAEGDEPGRRNLSNCQKASERGDLCAFGPDETRRSVDPVEHSGGARQKFNEGIYSISGNSERFCIRTGNSASFMCENKISNGIRSPDGDESAERNSENNQFDDNKTQKQELEKKLIPDHYSLITETAKAVLTARAKYPDCSLAELYGENMFLFPELEKAHKENDRAVMRAYGFDERMTESEIVAALFEMHRRVVGSRE